MFGRFSRICEHVPPDVLSKLRSRFFVLDLHVDAGYPAHAFEVSTLVCGTGFTESPVLISQERDGDISASYSSYCAQNAQFAFKTLLQASEAMRRVSFGNSKSLASNSTGKIERTFLSPSSGSLTSGRKAKIACGNPIAESVS